MNEASDNWQKCETQVFWGEVAPCDHVVQIYKTDELFLDSLEEFVNCGIDANDCVIIIGTVNHLKSLENRLKSKGRDVDAITDDDQLILLNAEFVLSKFMRNERPDSILFNNMLSQLIQRAKNKNRKVRAFGEMVAMLWAQGNKDATIRLEGLWNKFCETEAFCLFCAYPQSGFTQDVQTSIDTICKTHTKVINGELFSQTKIEYKAC